MTLVVRIKKQDEPPEDMVFRDAPVRIGRNPLNEIFIDHPMMSSWHAVVRVEGERVILMDLGSTNGIRFNGAALQPRVPVDVGQHDEIFFGPIQISLILTDVSYELLKRGMLQKDAGFDSEMLGQRATMFYSTGESAPGAEEPLDEDPSTVFMHRQELASDIQAVLHAVERTRPAYEAWESAWVELERQVEARLSDATQDKKSYVVQALLGDLPLINRMPAWSKLLARHGLSPDDSQNVDMEDWLHRLKGTQEAAEPLHQVLALERVGALLQTFASSFAALNRGWKQFGDEMGLQLAQQTSALTRAADEKEVLQILLDWSADGNDAIDDLKRAFADLAIHQVAVIHGVVEGVRSLLSKVSPGRLEGRPDSNGAAIATPSSLQRALAFLPLVRNARLGSLYRKLHAATVEEDRFTREIFGRSFAKAYFEMSGKKIGESES